jgi:hypothetical protein
MTEYLDRRIEQVKVGPSTVFRVISRIGGDQGWFSPDWMWRLRGVIDRLLGGPGWGKKRRDPNQLEVGDAVDFWRVTTYENPKRVELTTTMKKLGEAHLEYEVAPVGENLEKTRLTQTARFKPSGPMGAIYWFIFMPVHHYVFRAMMRGIASTAERENNEGITQDLFARELRP